MLRKIRTITAESGLAGLAARSATYGYRQVRPLLPDSSAVLYAGIPIGLDRKFCDQFFPGVAKATADIPDYEASLVNSLKKYLSAGDKVVVVGGGWGVTATIAALSVAPNGHVTCYEGSIDGVKKVKMTAERNGTLEWMTVNHAIVGVEISVYGNSQKGAVLSPEELPECDLLELDCEGAEVIILERMRINPRVVLVETHGLYGATSAIVEAKLKERGYSVTKIGAAEPRLARYCQENDINVLAGVLT